MLKAGQCAPEFTLTTPAGERVSLQEALPASRALLLVFLRHLG